MVRLQLGFQELVEVLEYALAFAISSGIAASGFLLLQGSYPLLGEMTAKAELSQVANAAELALVNNMTKTVHVDLRSASISCEGSLLSLSSRGTTYSAALNGQCSFSFPSLDGEHYLTFVPRNGALSLRVDGG